MNLFGDIPEDTPTLPWCQKRRLDDMDIAGLLIQALVCLSGFDLLSGVHDLLIILLILPSKVCGKKVEIRFEECPSILYQAPDRSSGWQR